LLTRLERKSSTYSGDGEDTGPNYLVMEYIEGVPISGPLPPQEAVRMALQIADALEATHAKGINHRDLKPANILQTRSGIKVLDFGLAKLEYDAASASETPTMTTEAGLILGTAAYMSPEQAQGKTVDHRSDIFAFGLVLYELLSGRRAFSGDTTIATLVAILHADPPSLNAPVEIARIISRCLRKSPSERFQSIVEVRNALQEFSAKPVVATVHRCAPVFMQSAHSSFSRSRRTHDSKTCYVKSTCRASKRLQSVGIFSKEVLDAAGWRCRIGDVLLFGWRRPAAMPSARQAGKNGAPTLCRRGKGLSGSENGRYANRGMALIFPIAQPGSARYHRGVSACAPKRRASSPWISSPWTPSGFSGCTRCSSSKSRAVALHWRGARPTPTPSRVTQQTRQVTWTLGERGDSVRFLIRDRDRKFTGGFDAVFEAQNIRIVRAPIQVPEAMGSPSGSSEPLEQNGRIGS
jgi:serine/threonine protein kinase